MRECVVGEKKFQQQQLKGAYLYRQFSTVTELLEYLGFFFSLHLLWIRNFVVLRLLKQSSVIDNLGSVLDLPSCNQPGHKSIERSLPCTLKSAAKNVITLVS